jgi:hypothetical protein
MPAARVVLLGVVLVLFQSHWVDDVGNGEPDTTGIAVSVGGSAALLVGFLSYGSRIGRVVYSLGLLFVAWVSLADLIGMRPDGTLVPSLPRYWSVEFGPLLTATVATTLACAVGLLVSTLRRRR